MKREEADAVPMRMRWGRGEFMIQTNNIQNTMEIFPGGSDRRAGVVVFVRSKYTGLALSIRWVVVSALMMTVCGPLCI